MATAEELVIRASLKDELSRPIRAVRSEVRRLADDADRTSTSALGTSKSLDRMSRGVGRLTKSVGRGLLLGLKAAAVGIAAMSAAAIVGGGRLLALASDAAETASAFQTVFRGVSGNVAGYLNKLNKRFGITTAELQRAATTFGVFGKAAGVSKKELGGFTKDLTGAGLDLASFYNADPTEVFTALRSGLAGEAEPLRQFGIFLSDSALKAKAATMGLTGELTESQKVMVRQAIIMASLGDAEGDLERTADGLANQWRKLKGQLKEGATVIGTALLPVVTPLVNKLTKGLGPIVERLSDRLPALTARWVDTAGQLGVTLGLFRSGDWELGVANLDRITGAGGRLRPALDLVKGILDDVGTILTGALLPAIRDVAGAIDPGWLTPLGAARALLGFLARNAGAVHVALVVLIGALALYRTAQLAANVATAVGSALTFIKTARTYGLSYALKAGGTASAIYTAAAWLANASLATGRWLVATASRVAHAAATKLAAGAARLAAAAQWAAAASLAVGRWIIATAALVAHKAVTVAVAGATRAYAAGQWLLNAAMSANPIGLIVVAIALLVGGLVLAYRRSETFRAVLATLWEKIKAGAGFVGRLFLKFTPLGQIITRFGTLKDAVAGAVEWIRKIRFPSAPKWLGKLNPFGDTAVSRARGTGGLASTAAYHRQLAGGGIRVTNALTGGGGRGHGSGDHQAGRALDLVGPGLNAYKSRLEKAGGYGAFHGDGGGRHLHAVYPAGDTTTSRTRRTAGGAGVTGATIIADGAVRIYVQGDASDVDRTELRRAVRQGIREAERDRAERAGG